MTECNKEGIQYWQRLWNVGMILRHNARHQHDPKPLLERITESPDNYASLKRQLLESKSDRFYVTTRIIDAIRGTNQQFTMQAHYLSKI